MNYSETQTQTRQYLINQLAALDAIETHERVSDPFAAIFDVAARIVNRKSPGFGRRDPQTLTEFWDTKTDSGQRNYKIMLELAKDDCPINNIANRLNVSPNLVTRVKDTVALMQEARLSGKPLPQYPAPSNKYKKTTVN